MMFLHLFVILFTGDRAVPSLLRTDLPLGPDPPLGPYYPLGPDPLAGEGVFIFVLFSGKVPGRVASKGPAVMDVGWKRSTGAWPGEGQEVTSYPPPNFGTTKTDGTHPTRMLSCFRHILTKIYFKHHSIIIEI